MVLLEIVLAMAIFAGIGAAALVSMITCVRAVRHTALEAEAADLAVSVLSQVQMELLPLVTAPPEALDPPRQDWTWQIVAEDVQVAPEVPPLVRLQVIVTNVAHGYTYRLVHLVVPPAEPASGEMP